MIVNNPMGDWLAGRHQGTEDTIALQRAADETRQNAYGLQRATQNDPFYSQILRDRAAASGIDTDVLKKAYASGDLDAIQHANALLHMMAPGMKAADYGAPGAFAAGMPTWFPGATAENTNNGPAFRFNTGNGTSILNPVGGIGSVGQLHQDAYGMFHQQQQNNLQQWRAFQEWAKMNGIGGAGGMGGMGGMVPDGNGWFSGIPGSDNSSAGTGFAPGVGGPGYAQPAAQPVQAPAPAPTVATPAAPKAPATTGVGAANTSFQNSMMDHYGLGNMVPRPVQIGSANFGGKQFEKPPLPADDVPRTMYTGPTK